VIHVLALPTPVEFSNLRAVDHHQVPDVSFSGVFAMRSAFRGSTWVDGSIVLVLRAGGSGEVRDLRSGKILFTSQEAKCSRSLNQHVLTVETGSAAVSSTSFRCCIDSNINLAFDVGTSRQLFGTSPFCQYGSFVGACRMILAISSSYNRMNLTRYEQHLLSRCEFPSIVVWSP
jgi:hypothetical protein